MKIILYSTKCPKCNILEKKLIQKELDFNLITDFDKKEMMKKGFLAAPILVVDNEYMDFSTANNWVNSL